MYYICKSCLYDKFMKFHVCSSAPELASVHVVGVHVMKATVGSTVTFALMQR